MNQTARQPAGLPRGDMEMMLPLSPMSDPRTPKPKEFCAMSVRSFVGSVLLSIMSLPFCSGVEWSDAIVQSLSFAGDELRRSPLASIKIARNPFIEGRYFVVSLTNCVDGAERMRAKLYCDSAMRPITGELILIDGVGKFVNGDKAIAPLDDVAVRNVIASSRPGETVTVVHFSRGYIASEENYIDAKVTPYMIKKFHPIIGIPEMISIYRKFSRDNRTDTRISETGDVEEIATVFDGKVISKHKPGILARWSIRDSAHAESRSLRLTSSVSFAVDNPCVIVADIVAKNTGNQEWMISECVGRASIWPGGESSETFSNSSELDAVLRRSFGFPLTEFMQRVSRQLGSAMHAGEAQSEEGADK